MKEICLLALALLATVKAVSFRDVITAEWGEFKVRHGKAYTDESEEHFRMKVYMENKHKIAKHNELYSRGLKTYKLAMNEFGDMLHHEFISIRNGYKRNYRDIERNGSTFLTPENIDNLPKSVNWTEKGYVTPVKDQGQCGSCWAFSTTGALEGQHFRKSKTLVSLSEQQLVDCSSEFGNEGCNGGLMDQAFQYIKKNGGIDTESSYPYESKDGTCRFKRRSVGATDTGFVDVPSGNEKKLKYAVATVGPISVAIDASHESFQFYSEGVYDEPDCNSEELDHGVLVTGYGVSDDGQDFWIVKNSWGTVWGLNGYILMARNKNNQCGIATQASYPLV